MTEGQARTRVLEQGPVETMTPESVCLVLERVPAELLVLVPEQALKIGEPVHQAQGLEKVPVLAQGPEASPHWSGQALAPGSEPVLAQGRWVKASTEVRQLILVRWEPAPETMAPGHWVKA